MSSRIKDCLVSLAVTVAKWQVNRAYQRMLRTKGGNPTALATAYMHLAWMRSLHSRAGMPDDPLWRHISQALTLDGEINTEQGMNEKRYHRIRYRLHDSAACIARRCAGLNPRSRDIARECLHKAEESAEALHDLRAQAHVHLLADLWQLA